ncbi:hypothetical protein HZB03_04775 [Candidatus Woesearchaeota archaeon]|nr:hypothetical protein [Candidatus Woesearchaeota archaeon]
MNKLRLIGMGMLMLTLLVVQITLAAAEEVTAEQITDLYNKALDKRDDLARRLAQQAQDTNNLNAADASAGLKQVDDSVGEGGNSGRPLPSDVRKVAEKTQAEAGKFLSKNKTPLGIGAGVLLGVLSILLLRRRRKEAKEVTRAEEKLLAQLSEDEKKLYQLFKNKKGLTERNTTELYRLFSEESGEEKNATRATTTTEIKPK